MPYFEDEDSQVLRGFAIEPTDSIAEFLAERFLRRRRRSYRGQSRSRVRSALYGAAIGAITGALLPSLAAMNLNKAGKLNEILAQVAKAMEQSPQPWAEPMTARGPEAPVFWEEDLPWMGFLCCECGNTQTYKPMDGKGGVTVAEAKAMGWTCKKGDDPEGFCGRWTCPICNEAHAGEPLRTQPEPEPEPEASGNGIFSKDVFGGDGKEPESDKPKPNVFTG